MAEPSYDLEALDRDGHLLLAQAVSAGDVEQILAAISSSDTADSSAEHRLARRGVVYAGRNLLSAPAVVSQAWRQPGLVELLADVLGPDCGVVRGLFFDKPPGCSWSLPWHQDLSIAVAEHRPESRLFTNPTTKAGVPHVIAPVEVLAAMLTLRIHLDDATDENGPLQVISGSHRNGKEPMSNPPPPAIVYARRGDVLAMRPLLSHASGNSLPATTRHRRILHFEFAASATLPEGFRWHTFEPIRATAAARG